MIVTKQGDTWDILALRQYGDEAFMSELIKANLNYRGIMIFSAGVQLNTPEIDTIPMSSNLPPWKR